MENDMDSKHYLKKVGWLNIFTLLPKLDSMKNYVHKYCVSKIRMIIYMNLIFSVMELAISLVYLIYCIFGHEEFASTLTLVVLIVTQIILYVVTIIIGRCSCKLQSIIILFYSLFYSIMVTETYREKFNEFIFARIAAFACIGIINTTYTIFQYLVSVIPLIIALCYPFIRTSCKFQIKY